jgi:hypothetical protein
MHVNFYRFRSIDALIGERQELQKQEVYFSAPEGLNDPIEGFKDLFWQGDHIVWRNLLRHYLVCLLKTISIALIAGNDFKSAISRGLIFGDLPDAPIKNTYERICAAFFANCDLERLPQLIADCNYPFRRDDLEFILLAIHGIAFTLIFRIFREDKIIPQAESPPLDLPASETTVDALKRTLTTIATNKDGLDADALRGLFSATAHVARQSILIRYLSDSDISSRAWHSIFYSFPEWYVDHIGDLVFPDWYAACFVADPTHAAMWGNYADGHKGVCLHFRAEPNANGQPMLKIRGLRGVSGSQKGMVMNYGDLALTFDKMNYVANFEPIDFFRTIGRLPLPTLQSAWYTDAEGNVSECAGAVFSSEEQWRKQYWDSFSRHVNAKLNDWRHEDEYRLILTSALDLFSDAKDRKLTYRFSDLEGIVFGIRTRLEDKEQIINIIRAKCNEHGRKAFTFSQATYAPYSGRIEILPLDLLRFE